MCCAGLSTHFGKGRPSGAWQELGGDGHGGFVGGNCDGTRGPRFVVLI